MVFDDVAQLMVAGASGEQEAARLQERVADLEGHLVTCVAQITQYEAGVEAVEACAARGLAVATCRTVHATSCLRGLQKSSHHQTGAHGQPRDVGERVSTRSA